MAKWLIENGAPLSPGDRQAYWESIHRDTGYDSVCSLTDSALVRDRIMRGLANLRADPAVLIPGCGSRTALQRQLLTDRPSATVVCADYPEVIAIASHGFTHPHLTYVAHDLAEVRWTESFDAVVCVNSIVSESDEDNRRILRNCCRALRPGGSFIGYFPTIFSPLEIALLSGDASRLMAMDLSTSTFYEAAQRARQIFYTPLRLRVICREAGLSLSTIEVAFLDADCLGIGAPWRNPGADDADLAIYELLVVAQRP